jgi:RND family efflux transporter MFP subunit
VERKPWPATEEVTGTVQARLRAIIEAKISGRIEQMLVVSGQTVKAGELLVQLDAAELQARLDQAVATRDQARRDLERLRGLLAQQAVSRQDFETAESRYQVSVAAVAEVGTMLGYSKIVAPFSGVITRKLADVGDLAYPGRALLEMDDPTALRLEAGIPESLIRQIQPGAKLGVQTAAGDPVVMATVSEIAPAADAASRTFNVKLELPPEAGWRAGQFARVSIPLADRPALLAPASAIVQRGQMELVFVIEHHQARLRLVKTGKRNGSDVELVSGVTPGEQLVAEGAALLRDGQPVEVKP